MAAFLPVVSNTPPGSQQAWDVQAEILRIPSPSSRSSPKYLVKDVDDDEPESRAGRAPKDTLAPAEASSGLHIPGQLADDQPGKREEHRIDVQAPSHVDGAASYNIIVCKVEGPELEDQEPAQRGRLSPARDREDEGGEVAAGEQGNRPSQQSAETPGSPGSNRSNKVVFNSFPVSETLKSANGRVRFREGVESSMQEYLENHCANGLSTMQRALATMKILLQFLVLLPTLSFGVLLLPLAPPEAGFLANWVFNYISHPILNYLTSRALVEMSLVRALEPHLRPSVAWIPRWFPLLGSASCLTFHIISNSLGQFPMPFVVSTSCIPSMWITLVVSSQFLPSEFCTPSSRNHFWFTNLTMFIWALQFVVLFVWLLTFPELPVALQLLSCGVVTAILSAAGWLVNEVGRRCMDIPGFIREENKIMILCELCLF